MSALRFADGATDVIEGLLCPFGGNFNGRDSYGTYFTARTDFCLDWFEVRPAIYHHGLDTGASTTPVGRITHVELRADGLWMQGQLDAHNAYYQDIRKLIEAGALGLSSGSMAHLVEIDEQTGEIQRWPLIEGSLTPTPSNLLAHVDFAAATSHFRSAGIAIPAETLALLDHPRRAADGDADGAGEDDADDAKRSADAVRANAASEAIPYERSFEDIREDIARLLNPDTPFRPYPYVWNAIMATYPDYVIVCRYEEGEGESYWKILYTLSVSQEPVLGEATQMESVFIPAATRAATGPLSLESQSLIRHAAALAERTKDLGERRYREGRVLSAANLKTLDEVADGLETHAKGIRDLTARARGTAEAAARAARYADPEARRFKIALLDL